MKHFKKIESKFLFSLLIMSVWSIIAVGQTTAKISKHIPEIEKWIQKQFAKGKTPPFSFICDGKPSAEFIRQWDYSQQKIESEEADVIKYLFTYYNPTNGLKVECTVKGYPSYQAAEWVLNFTNKGTSNSPTLEQVKVVDLAMQYASKGEFKLHYADGNHISKYDFHPRSVTLATGETKQPVSLGVDAGYKHVGLSASTEKAELYASEVELRQDITDLLSARRALRQSRRNRKTRYRAPRFDNRIRTKRKGWLAPSVENRINAHLSRIEAVLRLLPVTKITVETASFDLQLLKNPDISGKEYQEGEQLGFWNIREYVLCRDGHVCQHCYGRSKDPVLNVHHLESRRTGGDSPGNLITLCETCHKALHRGEITLKAKRGQSFRAEAFMGIMRWEVHNRLRALHPGIEVSNTYGYRTKHARIANGIAKSHCADAFCIAGNLGAERLCEFFFQKQTRRNNRQIHKLSILKGAL